MGLGPPGLAFVAGRYPLVLPDFSISVSCRLTTEDSFEKGDFEIRC